jgi:hypothetical protein
MKQIKTLSALAIVAAAITGCSGGAGSGGLPVQQAPQILGPVTAELDQDTTSQPLSFKITDNDTASALLQIAVSSANTDLIPSQGLTIEGAGADRALRITPATESVGTTTVTITARDLSGLATTASLTVKVNPVLVSFRSLTNEAFAKQETADESKVFGVTVQSDVDNDENAFDSLLQ